VAAGLRAALLRDTTRLAEEAFAEGFGLALASAGFDAVFFCGAAFFGCVLAFLEATEAVFFGLAATATFLGLDATAIRLAFGFGDETRLAFRMGGLLEIWERSLFTLAITLLMSPSGIGNRLTARTDPVPRSSDLLFNQLFATKSRKYPAAFQLTECPSRGRQTQHAQANDSARKVLI
jgi:hypothetical protein